MPKAVPPEFRRRTVEQLRLRETPISQIAGNPDIAQSCLRS